MFKIIEVVKSGIAKKMAELRDHIPDDWNHLCYVTKDDDDKAINEAADLLRNDLLPSIDQGAILLRGTLFKARGKVSKGDGFVEANEMLKKNDLEGLKEYSREYEEKLLKKAREDGKNRLEKARKAEGKRLDEALEYIQDELPSSWAPSDKLQKASKLLSMKITLASLQDIEVDQSQSVLKVIEVEKAAITEEIKELRENKATVYTKMKTTLKRFALDGNAFGLLHNTLLPEAREQVSMWDKFVKAKEMLNMKIKLESFQWIRADRKWTSWCDEPYAILLDGYESTMIKYIEDLRHEFPEASNVYDELN